MNPYINKFKESLIGHGIATSEEIVPCSPEEVEQIESAQGVKVPKMYRDFLLTMGRGAGKFYQGTDCFYPRLLEVREYALELLEEDDTDFSFPQDAFVFLVHQGYQFMYFWDESGSDEPQVYYFMEGGGKPEKKFSCFSDFLEKSIRDYLNPQQPYQ